MVGALGLEVDEPLVGGKFFFGRVGAEVEGDAVKESADDRRVICIISLIHMPSPIASSRVFDCAGLGDSPRQPLLRSWTKSVPASSNKSRARSFLETQSVSPVALIVPPS